MNSKYVEWLKQQGIKLYRGGGMYWRAYQGALIPAPATSCFVSINPDECASLLKESGAFFIRYESDPCNEETEWWLILCDRYKPENLTSKVRSMIKRGNRNCYVHRIDAEWLATYGYDCYCAAFARYKNALPVQEDIFRNDLLKTKGDPFEYWGVFVGDQLAGFCQCIIEYNEVSTNIIKYHPAFLQYYTSYALIASMMHHYVGDKGLVLSNSSRSILHDTQMQDFLLKLGFRKQFCHLNVIYKPWLKFLVKTLYPMHRLIKTLPGTSHIYKMQALLLQEELRRACSG